MPQLGVQTPLSLVPMQQWMCSIRIHLPLAASIATCDGIQRSSEFLSASLTLKWSMYSAIEKMMSQYRVFHTALCTYVIDMKNTSKALAAVKAMLSEVEHHRKQSVLLGF